MRIIDWRSDVCSSDLSITSVIARSRRDVRRDGPPSGCRVEKPRQRSDRSTRIVPSTIACDARLGASTSRAIRAMPERSEEHTSELQSLMRISYAVFCLKKKKPHPHDERADPTERPSRQRHDVKYSNSHDKTTYRTSRHTT